MQPPNYDAYPISAILRLVEIRDGAIEIDGVNIQRIDLSSLRTGVAIIPQDSLLCVRLCHLDWR